MSKENLEKFLSDNKLYLNIIYNLEEKVISINHDRSNRSFSKIVFSIERNRFSNCDMLTASLINDRPESKGLLNKEMLLKINYFKFYFFDDDFKNIKDSIKRLKIKEDYDNYIGENCIYINDNDYEPILDISEFKNFINIIKLDCIDFDYLDQNLCNEVNILNMAKERIKECKQSIIDNEKLIEEKENSIKKISQFLEKEKDNRPIKKRKR